jgi:glycosyltransferase involved in cell wall biosynthesis
MSTKSPHIALLMMVKNEQSMLHLSLESCIGYVNSIVIYDTGSTDNTIQILKDFSEKNKIPLRLKEGEFTNFSESRNVSLDFADTFEDIDFILLLDCNDQLQGGEKLIDFCKKELDSNNNAYLMCQHWWSGKYDKYFNARLVKPGKAWRYKGSVHEYMADTAKEKGPNIFKMSDDIILYQDRTKDDNKTSKRFTRDKDLLLADHKKDPTEPRTLFYLAQTCSCLNQIDETFYYYKLRTELEGFQEEKFHAYLRCGEYSEKLNHSWYDSHAFYMKALEHSMRAEPLIKIAQHYIKINKWLLAFTFSDLACSLKYPTHAILFVDKYSYDYTRWHVTGIAAYYCGYYAAGKAACLKAIESGVNTELDTNNLKFYINKEKEISESNIPLTKIQFINKTIEESKKQNSSIPLKDMYKMAKGRWKNRNNK